MMNKTNYHSTHLLLYLRPFAGHVSLMNPLVRDLCKRFVLVARRHPSGERYVKERAMAALRRNAGLTDEVEIKRAVVQGRRAAREAEDFAKFCKYRVLRKRYVAPAAAAADD